MLALVGASVYFYLREQELEDKRGELIAAAHKRFDAAFDDRAYGPFLVARLHDACLAKARVEIKVRTRRSDASHLSYDSAAYMAEMERLVAIHQELGERSPHWLAYKGGGDPDSGQAARARPDGGPEVHGAIDSTAPSGPSAEDLAREALHAKARDTTNLPPAGRVAALEALCADHPRDAFLARRLEEAKEQLWLQRLDHARGLADAGARVEALEALKAEYPDRDVLDLLLARARTDKLLGGRVWHRIELADGPGKTALLVEGPTGGVVAIGQGEPIDADGPALAISAWDGKAWTRTLTGSPADPRGREHAAAARDATSGVTWVLGGGVPRAKGLYPDRKTLRWDGSTLIWQGGPASPEVSIHHAMVFAAAQRELVAFGGLDHQGKPSAATWSGKVGDRAAAWSRRDVAGPPARYRHAMAYDAGREVAVLFGGRTARGDTGGDANLGLADTWEWDGARWTERACDPRPPAREGHALVHDPGSGLVLCLGGGTPVGENAHLLDDAWGWDGERWHALDFEERPGHRFGARVAWDSTRKVVVLYGGVDRSGGPVHDVWELAPKR